MRALAGLSFVALLAVFGGPSHAAVPAISAGERHSVALKADGTVRAWGDDKAGQLGVGRRISSSSPVSVRQLSGVIKVSGGWGFTVALKDDGTVWSWGHNASGELGDGTNTDRSSPVRVDGLTGVVAISAGYSHAVALKADGSVWSWGSNYAGQLGDGTTASRSTPVRVTAVSDVIAVSSSASYTVAVKRDGSVWGWGTGPAISSTDSTRPWPVLEISGAVAVSAGQSHAVVLAADGTVWTFGYNDRGQLGDGTTITRSGIRVPGLTGVVAIAAGRYLPLSSLIAPDGDFTLAVKSDGTVWAWGDNGNGQLGDGTTLDRWSPVLVQGLSGVAAIAAGAQHSIALKRDGSLWSWGDNRYGQLGDGTTVSSSLPRQVPVYGAFTAISAGSWHTVAATAGATAMTWGFDAFGQLGDGAVASRSTPAAVSGLDPVQSVSAGDEHTLALKDDGTVWAWGNNLAGQLGDGTTTFRSSPVRVSGLQGVRAISAGSGYSTALKGDGTVWVWGYNGYNQLGDGTTTTRALPVPVPGLSGVSALSAGAYHSLVLKGDGEVWAWGYNATGQVGDGTTSDRASPIRIGGLPRVTALAAGGFHSIALAADGSVWTWGRNDYGELGDGAAGSNRATPGRVSGLAGVIAIAAGSWHSVALKGDGTVWAWGLNGSGQLGDGTTSQRATPVQVADLDGVVAIAAARYYPGEHTLALKRDGTVWAWGLNSSGQVGDGTFATRARPVVTVREGGGGALQSNDWFLDLDPGVAKVIPGGKVPSFLVVTSGSAASDSVDVRADITFRAQDVGKPIYVFAYVPASLLRTSAALAKRDPGDTPKDDAVCVLGQLTPSGLQPASASSLVPYVNGVLGAQQQSVSVLTNVTATQVAGSTFCVGAGATASQSIEAANSQCVATVPGATNCLQPTTTPPPVANTPGPLSGLWWNSGESGWGINFTQRAAIVFAAWYTYDAAGNPKWYVAPRCVLPAASASGSCTETLYQVNGPVFFGAAFNPSAAQVTAAGSLQLSFGNANAGSMTYTLAGQTRTVAITRQPFPGGTTPPPVDYTDLWWNPAESGWGLAITHQFNVMFLAWYVYDAGGRPVWYVASNCNLNAAKNGCTGTLYRTTGPAFGPTFDSTRVTAIEAGTATLSFSDANNGTISYTVNGVSATKVLTRQIF